MLKVSAINVYYGAIHAVKNVSLEVGEGELVTLIGANGAGKSTTLKAVCGQLKPRTGSITFQTDDITGRPAHLNLRNGLALCPEGRRLFANLTVRENLEMGAYTRKDSDGIKKDLEKSHALFPILDAREKQLAGTLSGGEQQMVAIARAIMSRPKLLMLDEPSLGLAPKLVETIFHVLRDLKQQGTTILLVEQNAKQALNVADRAYVLETGHIIKEGPAKELADDPDVKKAYLGA